MSQDEEGTAPFVTLLQLRQLWFALKLREDEIEIRSIPNAESLFFWIRYKQNEDKKTLERGLFTFAKASRGPHQLGYVTRDPDLLNTFSTSFDEKWNSEQAEAKLPWLEFLMTFDSMKE